MIFFGSRSREVVGDLIQGNLCPECGRAEHQSFGVQNYFHIYWIPVFPTSKTVGLVCTHCKKAQTGKELLVSHQEHRFDARIELVIGHHHRKFARDIG